MKLTYRGNSYEVPDSNLLGFDAANQPKIKLMYRGDTYDYNPGPMKVSETITANQPSLKLIYRGMIYERKLQLAKAY
jgi:hypothetical protein